MNKKKLTIPTKIGDKIYTGDEQDSGIQCPEGSKSSGDLKGTKVKSYTQICTLSSTTNYIWSDGTVDPIKIEWKILSLEDSYKVTFISEGKELYSSYVSSGEKISRPTPDPTKDNYKFDDWYTDETFKTKFDFNTAIKQNVSVYAKFIEEKADKIAKTESNKTLLIGSLLIAMLLLVGVITYLYKKKRKSVQQKQ